MASLDVDSTPTRFDWLRLNLVNSVDCSGNLNSVPFLVFSAPISLLVFYPGVFDSFWL